MPHYDYLDEHAVERDMREGLQERLISPLVTNPTSDPNIESKRKISFCFLFCP
jgi:hypothetical protein